MKLHTSVAARRDGSVWVDGLDGRPFLFTPDDGGELACFVDHAPTIAHLIATGHFWPADERDFEKAVLLANAASVASSDDDDADDPAALDALPIEAETPPTPKRRGRPPRAVVTPP